MKLGTRALATYIVLVDILAADALDAELVHADTGVLASRVVAATGGMRSIDFIGVLKT